MDWVQVITIMLGCLILCATIRKMMRDDDEEFWPTLVFAIVLFIPFARVLGLL